MKCLNYFFSFWLVATPAFGAMTEAGCKAKVKAAVQAETGATVTEGTFNVLLSLCKGILDEIKQNGEILPNTFTNSAGAVSGTGKIQ
jgi:hypothetical protein